MISDADQGGIPESGGPVGGPPPPPPAPAYPAGQPAYGTVPKTEPMAIAALVVSLIGLLFLGIILGIVALVLANTANKRIQESGGMLTGQNLVTAARVIGILDIVLAVVLIGVLINT